MVQEVDFYSLGVLKKILIAVVSSCFSISICDMQKILDSLSLYLLALDKRIPKYFRISSRQQVGALSLFLNMYRRDHSSTIFFIFASLSLNALHIPILVFYAPYLPPSHLIFWALVSFNKFLGLIIFLSLTFRIHLTGIRTAGIIP